MTTATEMIEAERARHAQLGWDAAHDAGHAPQLAAAAFSYSRHASPAYRAGRGDAMPAEWPWADEFWKPKTEIRDLVRAGALYLAAADAARSAQTRGLLMGNYRDVVEVLESALLAESDGGRRMFSSGKHRCVVSYGAERPSPSNPLARPLANPANPILAAFRSIEGRLTTIATAADYWLSALDSYDLFGGYVAWEHSAFRPIIDATDEQRAHARAVLDRLADAGLTDGR